MKKTFMMGLLGLCLYLAACNENNLTKKEEKNLNAEDAAADGIDTTNESLDIDTIHNKHLIYDNP